MKWIKALCVAVALCVLLIGVASAQNTIKIGVLAPLTGPAAADGESVKYSLDLAVERVNNQGGVLGKQVQLVTYDDRMEPKDSVALSRKLIEQDKVVAVVGASYSNPMRAVAPIFQEEKIPFVAAYAVHPDITKAGNFCFRNGFLGTVEGKAAAYTAVKTLKGKKIALLVSDNDFGRTLAEGFKYYIDKNTNGAAQIVSTQAYPMSEKDFRAYLSKIKQLNPDVIFSSGYYFQTGPVVKQAREMGITAHIIGEEGADSPKFLEIAGAKEAEGFVIVTNLNRDDKRPEVQQFLKTYEQRFKIQPDMVGASAYDAFMMIVDAIKRANSTNGDAVRNALANINNFNGLTGQVKKFEKGEVVKDVQVQVVKGGRFHNLAVVSDPDLIVP